MDADSVGPAGTPADSDLTPHGWLGTVGSDSAYVRTEPKTSAPVVGEIHQGATVAVQNWVACEEVYPDQPGWRNWAMAPTCMGRCCAGCRSSSRRARRRAARRMTATGST